VGSGDLTLVCVGCLDLSSCLVQPHLEFALVSLFVHVKPMLCPSWSCELMHLLIVVSMTDAVHSSTCHGAAPVWAQLVIYEIDHCTASGPCNTLY